MAGAHLPLVGIPTHDILNASSAARTAVGGNQAQWQPYGTNGAGRMEGAGQPEGLTWPELLGRIDRPVYLCGEVDPEQRRNLEGDPRVELAPPSECVRRPGFLAEMAWEKLKGAKRPEAGTLAPIYLRSRDEVS
jgi:tRNA threonylcarbamoyladenosine biosynthesis protein TsaB